MKAAITKMLLSAFLAGVLAGLLDYAGGVTWKAAVLAGCIMAVKDLHSYMSQSPQDAARHE